MSAPIQNRLAELRSEREAGERILAALERRQQECRDTLLRIGGAIQVLEELEELEAADDRPGAAEPARIEPVA
jgi:hypothetical protein